MNKIIFLPLWLFLITPVFTFAQVIVRTDYTTSSSLRKENGNKYKGGDIMNFSGRYTIPFSIKKNENNQSTIWSSTISGNYAILNNKAGGLDFHPEKVIDLNFSIIHLRPLSEKWSLIASLGVGVFSEPNRITSKSILFNGGGIFVYKLNENINIGIGAGVTTAFGAPIVMPMSYAKMKFDGRYIVEIDMGTKPEISVLAKIKDNLSIKLIALEIDGISSVMEQDNKSLIYSSTMMRSILMPELKLGKSSTAFLGIGSTWMRSVRLSDRNYKSFIDAFKKEENSYKYSPAGYITLGLKFGF